jgi:TPR repeat protein
LDNLAWCYRFGEGVEKDEKKAFELYLRYQEKFPDSSWVSHMIAECYDRGVGVERDELKALEYYEKAVVLDPNNSAALNGLAWFLITSKDPTLHNYPRAIELTKRSIALDENKYNLDTLAVAYFKNGQYSEAVKMQERIIEFWKKNHPGKPVSEGKLKRLAKYKKVAEESTESP